MGSTFRIGPEDLIRAARKAGRELPPSRAKAYLGILDFPSIENAQDRAVGGEEEKDKASQAEILRQLKRLGLSHFF